MARTKTNTVNVKVDDKGTKIAVKVQCADVSSLTREALESLYTSQWKSFMYSTVQATIKELYPSVAVNLSTLENIKRIPGVTEEQIAMFVGLQKSGGKFETELPNLFTLKSDLQIEYSRVSETETESDDTPELGDDSEETEN